MGMGYRGCIPLECEKRCCQAGGCVISVIGERGRGRGGTWVWVLLRALLGWWRVGDAERWGCGDNGRWRLVLGLHRQYVAGPHGMLLCFIHRVLGGIDLHLGKFTDASPEHSLLTSGEWW